MFYSIQESSTDTLDEFFFGVCVKIAEGVTKAIVSQLVVCCYIRIYNQKKHHHGLEEQDIMNDKKGTEHEAAQTSDPACPWLLETVLPSYTAISCFISLKPAVFPLNTREQM